ncbi:hypothetical protein D8M04_03880 [Oceanobacillus piezotolerans]|uniref:Uncharacterized protein n=1 Tax=Oceanobacillus piezotolerans TaxID=2448030 RepID=A0A498DMX8_9BACI|nr:hypothetical protein [Oceanobacillus piezotolerans]RLL48410.1 hypothetical protein D8M04_03880 [Oceanobacillus piezotolerans]
MREGLKTIIILMIFSFIVIVVMFLQKDEYNTLVGLEKLFIKNDISITSKPIENENKLDFAKEQRIYELKDNKVYVYILNEIDLERADYIVSNEILEDYVVSSTNSFIFAYSDTHLQQFSPELYVVIDEITESEK